MKKTIYRGKTSPEIIKLKNSSELVAEKTGQASYLMQEIRYKEGLTFKFDYWFDPNTENEDHMTELTVFGSKNKISKIEKELSQPSRTDLNEDPNPFPHSEKKGGPFNPDSLKKY